MKNRKVFLVLFLSILTFSAVAQRQKNWLSVSIGTAVPFNDFSATKFTDTILHSGFAKTGFGFNVAYTRQLTHSLGLTSMFMGNSNNSDISAMQKDIQRIIKGNSEIGDFTYSGNIGNWSTGMLLIGPSIHFGESDFRIEIRGLLGVGMGISPEYDYIITQVAPAPQGKVINFKQQSDNAVAFAWNVGAGFKYRFNRMFARINVDYSGAKLDYKNINIQFYDPNEVSGQEYIDRASKMSLQTDIMQITGGIGYLF